MRIVSDQVRTAGVDLLGVLWCFLVVEQLVDPELGVDGEQTLLETHLVDGDALLLGFELGLLGDAEGVVAANGGSGQLQVSEIQMWRRRVLAEMACDLERSSHPVLLTLGRSFQKPSAFSRSTASRRCCWLGGGL